jgi:hypothetical protein
VFADSSMYFPLYPILSANCGELFVTDFVCLFYVCVCVCIYIYKLRATCLQ